MHYIPSASRDQAVLFPEVLDDYITEENPIRFIDAFVDKLDMVALGFEQSTLNTTGRPPYHPSILLKLYIYGYLNRIRSSRRLETECHRNVELMWLLSKLKPDHKTIANFVAGMLKPLKKYAADLPCYVNNSTYSVINYIKNNFFSKKLYYNHVAKQAFSISISLRFFYNLQPP